VVASGIFVILVGWALHATGVFMVPIVFSIFLALLVAPLDRGVARRVPDVLKKMLWLNTGWPTSCVRRGLMRSCNVGFSAVNLEEICERERSEVVD